MAIENIRFEICLSYTYNLTLFFRRKGAKKTPDTFIARVVCCHLNKASVIIILCYCVRFYRKFKQFVTKAAS